MAVRKIVGPMFSGKTDTALQAVSRWLDSGRAAVAVYVAKNGDQRYGETAAEVTSHRTAQQRTKHAGLYVHRCDHLTAQLVFDMFDAALDGAGAVADHVRVVVIDEAQFFEVKELHNAVRDLADAGYHVYVCGLDYDSNCEVFGGVLSLPADETDCRTAVCVECGAPAPFTRRHVFSPTQVVVGGRAEYSAVCRRHHPALSPKTTATPRSFNQRGSSKTAAAKTD